MYTAVRAVAAWDAYAACLSSRRCTAGLLTAVLLLWCMDMSGFSCCGCCCSRASAAVAVTADAIMLLVLVAYC